MRAFHSLWFSTGTCRSGGWSTPSFADLADAREGVGVLHHIDFHLPPLHNILADAREGVGVLHAV